MPVDTFGTERWPVVPLCRYAVFYALILCCLLFIVLIGMLLRCDWLTACDVMSSLYNGKSSP